MVDKAHDDVEEKEPVQVPSPRADQPTSHNESCIKASAEENSRGVQSQVSHC